MSIDIAALLAPISPEAPAGADARGSDTYEQVSAEIDKMIALSGSVLIDWNLVARHAADIFATQSKDFMLAAWLSAAWMELHDIQGLKAGLELHAGLIHSYWENSFPPLKRLRGRRNALAWWVERAGGWLENHPQPPLDPAFHAAMLEAATRIDQGLAEHDPESPPLGGFVRQIKTLEILPEAAPAPATDATAGTDGEAGAPATAQDPTDATGPVPAHGDPAGDGAASPAAGTPAAPTPTISAVPPPAPSAARNSSGAALPAMPALPDTLASLDDILAALSSTREPLTRVAGALLEIDRFQPLLIEITRFAARAALLSSPPASAGATALAPPPVAIADAFTTIRGAGNAEGLVAFCESRIPAFPFWLDLDCQSARGYGMLGEAGATMRQAIVRNVLAFTDRLPGIETLSFSDGTPFADDDTLQWLESCRAQGGGSEPQDAFSATRQQAQAAAHDGRQEQAMQLYQSFIQSSRSGRDQFRTRIALLELLLATHGDINPMPLAQPLIDDCSKWNLDDWEPELAADAWQAVLKACRQALASPALADEPALRLQYQQQHHQALQQLARVDFPAAGRYSK